MLKRPDRTIPFGKTRTSLNTLKRGFGTIFPQVAGSWIPIPIAGFMIIDAGTVSYDSFRPIIKTVHVEAGILVHIPPEPAFTYEIMLLDADESAN